MSDTLKCIQALVHAGEVRVTDHGDEALTDDRIAARDALAGMEEAVVVEDYPDAMRGPTVLTLQKDQNGRSMHVLWGILKGTDTPAHLVTAYYPNPDRWTDDFMRRRK